MKTQITKLAIVCATTLTIGSSTCQAGPILDWLFPNRASRRAASDVGRLTYRIPANAYQYNMSGYSPTTAYRSVWAPVPVTQYRPVGYVNPLSTGTQTNMLPCSSSEWQARRVPYTSYQPSSLFSGGSGWQSGGQWLPVQGYQASSGNQATGFQPTTVGYPGAQVNYDQATPWESVSPTTTNYGASPISTGWTTVGSGVSHATPGGSTGLLSFGNSNVTRAGYPDGDSFTPSAPSRVTPLPSSMDSSWQPVSEREVRGYGSDTWRPTSEGQQPPADYCKNCPKGDQGSAGQNSAATDWEPIQPAASQNRDYRDRDYRDRDYRDPDFRARERDEYDRSRTRVTPPADTAPVLPQIEERRRYDHDYDAERARRDDLYRWERIREKGAADLTPVRRPNSETETMYRPPRTFDVNNQRVRPAIQQADPYDSNAASSDAVYRQTAPATQARPVPFLKPIPDLNRPHRHQQNVQRPVAPIPSLLDGSEERTANMNQVAPDRRAVPIDWNLVDIDRRGRLTRVTAPQSTSNHSQPQPGNQLTPVTTPSTLQLEPPRNQEGGWRRVR